MKNIIIILLLLLAGSIQTQAQEYIPPAQEHPQWSINLYFEDATGAKDTLTIGYDPFADPYWTTIDEQFDEGWQWIDTTQFNVYILKYGTAGDMYPIYPPIDTDSVRKKSIASWATPGIEFGWVHGQLPVTLKWDEDKLDSPDLPPWFPDIDPYPRARIDMWYIMNEWLVPECLNEISDPTPPTNMLTGFPDYNWPMEFCIFSDSLVWGSEGDGEPGYYIVPPEVLVMPFEYVYWIVDIDEIGNITKIYPNPAENILTVETDNCNDIEYTILNIYGHEILKGQFDNNINQIDISFLISGVYFLKTNSFTFKFIKL